MWPGGGELLVVVVVGAKDCAMQLLDPGPSGPPSSDVFFGTGVVKTGKGSPGLTGSTFIDVSES